MIQHRPTTGRDTADAVAALLERAQSQAKDAVANNSLFDARRRLAEPLRLAIAGKVKAGKSTLLNALLGEPLALTDASECTKIVTWYRHGATPAVRLIHRDGSVHEARWSRSDGPLTIDLGGHTAAEMDHIEVRWPARRLRDVTIIDTPGVASISTEVSARTHAVLSAESGTIPVADAVIYLMRHTHPKDIRFLEAFHDDEVAHGTPINAVGVLSRADEVGSCRLDAMTVARTIADRYEHDPRLHWLCPIIVPVDALLGYAAITLSPAEHQLLDKVAALPPAECDQLLLTTDRFIHRQLSTMIDPSARRALLDHLGLFGVRLAVHLIRTGHAGNLNDLRRELSSSSGLKRLQHVLLIQFQQRSRLLRARTAVDTLNEVLDSGGCTDPGLLRAALERLIAGDHELEELRLLTELRNPPTDLNVVRAAELERIIGGRGSDPWARLGLAPDSDIAAVRQAATSELSTWRRIAGHPMSSRTMQRLAAVAVRSLEGLIATSIALDARPPGRSPFSPRGQ